MRALLRSAPQVFSITPLLSPLVIRFSPSPTTFMRPSSHPPPAHPACVSKGAPQLPGRHQRAKGSGGICPTITGSQHGRGWQGPLWVTQPNPLPKQGHPEQAAQHRVQVGLEYLQRRRLHSLPGQPMDGLIGEGRQNEFCTRRGACSSVSVQGRFRCGPGCDSAKVTVNLEHCFLHFMEG